MMMSSPLRPRPHWLRVCAAAVGAIASAALFGAAVASLLSTDNPQAKAQLQNPFDVARPVR